MSKESDSNSNNLCTTEDAFEKFSANTNYNEEEYITLDDIVSPTYQEPETSSDLREIPDENDVTTTFSNSDQEKQDVNTVSKSDNEANSDDNVESLVIPKEDEYVESSFVCKEDENNVALSEDNTSPSKRIRRKKTYYDDDEFIPRSKITPISRRQKAKPAGNALKSDQNSSLTTRKKRGRKPKNISTDVITNPSPVHNATLHGSSDASIAQITSEVERVGQVITNPTVPQKRRPGRPRKNIPEQILTQPDSTINNDSLNGSNVENEANTEPLETKKKRGRRQKRKQNVNSCDTSIIVKSVNISDNINTNTDLQDILEGKKSRRKRRENKSHVSSTENSNIESDKDISIHEKKDDDILNQLSEMFSEQETENILSVTEESNKPESTFDNAIENMNLTNSLTVTAAENTELGNKKLSTFEKPDEELESNVEEKGNEINLDSNTNSIHENDDDEADDICLSILKNKIHPSDTCKDDNDLTSDIIAEQQPTSVEGDLSNEKDSGSKRNVKMPVMEDFEYNIDSVLCESEKKEEIDNSLLVEDTSKRSVRKRKQMQYEVDSDEDPFANIELSDDDNEPKRNRKGRYNSDDEYVPIMEKRSRRRMSESCSDILDADEDLQKSPRKRKNTKRSDSTSQRKRGKKNKEATEENEIVVDCDQEDKHIEDCVEISVSEIKENASSSVWGTTNEFENFLAKKIINSNIKIKKCTDKQNKNITPLEIPVIDQNKPNKLVDECSQTYKMETKNVYSQTDILYEVTMKDNVILTKDQSEKACEFLNNIVTTTVELGQLMAEKSSDFIKKKINTAHVTNTMKVDYCVKKSFLLFKLAKHNLEEMEKDLAKQYEEFLKNNDLLKYRLEPKKLEPTPKPVDDDSDCEIVETPTNTKPNSNSTKATFNPKTVFLNKELSIKIAKKPTETEKKIKIAGKHAVWINDSVMIKKVKPTQSFLAQDSRNKKPPDNFITAGTVNNYLINYFRLKVISKIVKNFFKNYYRQKVITICAPFTSPSWSIVTKPYICNYFVVTTEVMSEPPLVTSNSVDEVNSEILPNSTVSSNPDVNTLKPLIKLYQPESLITLCTMKLQKYLSKRLPLLSNGTKNNSEKDLLKESSRKPLSLFQLCITAINNGASSSKDYFNDSESTTESSFSSCNTTTNENDHIEELMFNNPVSLFQLCLMAINNGAASSKDFFNDSESTTESSFASCNNTTNKNDHFEELMFNNPVSLFELCLTAINNGASNSKDYFKDSVSTTDSSFSSCNTNTNENDHFEELIFNNPDSLFKIYTSKSSLVCFDNSVSLCQSPSFTVLTLKILAYIRVKNIYFNEKVLYKLESKSNKCASLDEYEETLLNCNDSVNKDLSPIFKVSTLKSLSYRRVKNIYFDEKVHHKINLKSSICTSFDLHENTLSLDAGEIDYSMYRNFKVIKSLNTLCTEKLQSMLMTYLPKSRECKKVVNPESLRLITLNMINKIFFTEPNKLKEPFLNNNLNEENFTIDCINTLSEEAFHNIEHTNFNLAEYADINEEESHDFDDDYQEDFENETEQIRSENTWSTQVQLEELRSCVTPIVDTNTGKEAENILGPTTTQIKLEPEEDTSEMTVDTSLVKLETLHNFDEIPELLENIVTKSEPMITVDSELQTGRRPSYDVDAFESFVQSNKIMRSINENNDTEVFTQSMYRVRRQFEPDYEDVNDLNNSLLVPQTFEPLLKNAKGSLMESSSDEGDTIKKQVGRKKADKRKTRLKKAEVKANKDIASTSKDKQSVPSDIAVITRRMRDRIRQEEKKIESSDSETENVTLNSLKEKKKHDRVNQTKDVPINITKNILNDAIPSEKPSNIEEISQEETTDIPNNEIQCNAVDSTEQVNETVTPENNNFRLDNNEVKDHFLLSMLDFSEPAEMVECEPTMPIFNEPTDEKKTRRGASKKNAATKASDIKKVISTDPSSPNSINLPIEAKEKKTIATNNQFTDHDGWHCYAINPKDKKLYQQTYIPLDKLPEAFVETYFHYQEIAGNTEEDYEVDRLTNLSSLSRTLSGKDAKPKSKQKVSGNLLHPLKLSGNVDKGHNLENSDHYAELTPSEDEGANVDDEEPPPIPCMKRSENNLAKDSLMDDNDSDTESHIKVKEEPADVTEKSSSVKERSLDAAKLGSQEVTKEGTSVIKMESQDVNEASPETTVKRRPGPKSKTRVLMKPNAQDLMLTADKVMNKELTLLHTPAVLKDGAPEVAPKSNAPTTKPKLRTSIRTEQKHIKEGLKVEEDSSSEEEKQWVNTKEKLLKRLGKKEDAIADDAKRAKLVSEFIEKRGDADTWIRRKPTARPRRSRKKLLEKHKQLRVLSRELLRDPMEPLGSGKRYSQAFAKGRRNIRKVIDKKSLAASTVIANMEELNRKTRLNAKQNKLREILGCEEGVNVLVINDEVCLEYDFEEERPVVTIHPFFTKVMKAHQYEGVKFMWDACFESLEMIESGHPGGGCILAHCMGLGKTLQVLALLHTVLTHPRVGMSRVLVCCPLSTVLNWVDEIHKWIGPVTNQIKVFELSKLRKTYERAYQLEDWYNGGGIFIIGYELFRSLTTLDPDFDDVRPTIINKIRTALLDPGPDIIVCDEGHLLKNDCSVLAVAMSRVVTKRRIVLTGTPMQNNLREYYCMVNFVKPNLLGKYSEYSNRFENPIMNGQHRDSSEEDIKLMKARTHILHKVLEGCLQRQEASVLYPYLPKKHEYTVFIPLTKCQWDLYKHYITRYGKNSKQSILKDFHILQKIWSHPQVLHNFQMKSRDEKNRVKLEKLEDDLAREDLVSEDMKPEETEVWWLNFLDDGTSLNNLESSNKFVAVFRILNECNALGDKVLIFSTSLFSLDGLEYFLKKINKWSLGQEYYRLDGSVPAEVRQKWCREFNAENNRTTKLFLISTRAGCLGLNMTAANRVIILDTSWNPAHDIQSIFRVYRFGQKKDCYIYRLVALGTMEQKIYERSVTKQAVACRVVDEQQIDRHYNMAELTELYRFDEFGASVESGVAVGIEDVALLRVARDAAVHAVHEHDSLLRGSSEQGLPEHERNAAWMQFQQEHANKQMQNEIQEQNELLKMQQQEKSKRGRKSKVAKLKLSLPQDTSVQVENDNTKPPSQENPAIPTLQDNSVIPTQQDNKIVSTYEAMIQAAKIIEHNNEEPKAVNHATDDSKKVAEFVPRYSLREMRGRKLHVQRRSAKRVPVQSPPVKSVPVQSPTVKSVPVQSPSVKSLPLQNPSVKSLPVQSPPVKVQETPEPTPPSTALQTNVDKNKILEEEMIHGITRILKQLNFKPNNEPHKIMSLINNVKNLVFGGGCTVNDDLSRHIASFTMQRKLKSVPAITHFICEAINRSINEENVPVPAVRKRGRPRKSNKGENISNTPSTSMVKPIIEISVKETKERPRRNKTRTETPAEKCPQNIIDLDDDDVNIVVDKPIITLTENARSKPNKTTANVDESILLSDEDDIPIQSISKKRAEKPNVLAKKTKDVSVPVAPEKIPLHPSLLTNSHFIKIVAHTYLDGNKMLDEDAAILAAQYSTSKTLREYETTGKDIVSGPIYDIAMEVLGIDFLKKVHLSNPKVQPAAPTVEPNVTVNLKESTTSTPVETKNYTNKKSKPGPLSKKMKVTSEPAKAQPEPQIVAVTQTVPKQTTTSILPTTNYIATTSHSAPGLHLPSAPHVAPVSQLPAMPQLVPAPSTSGFNVVPVGLFRTTNAQAPSFLEQPVHSECILPDDDDVRIIEDEPTIAPTPTVNPVMAIPNNTLPAGLVQRKSQPIVLKSISNGPPGGAWRVVSSPAEQTVTTPVPQQKTMPTLTITGNVITCTAQHEAPKPPEPTPNAGNELINLDSDEEESITPHIEALPQVRSANQPVTPILGSLRAVGPNGQMIPVHPIKIPASAVIAPDKLYTVLNSKEKSENELDKNAKVKQKNTIRLAQEAPLLIMKKQAEPAANPPANPPESSAPKASQQEEPKVPDKRHVRVRTTSSSSNSSRSESPYDPLSILKDVVQIRAAEEPSKKTETKKTKLKKIIITMKKQSKMVDEVNIPTASSSNKSLLKPNEMSKNPTNTAILRSTVQKELQKSKELIKKVSSLVETKKSKSSNNTPIKHTIDLTKANLFSSKSGSIVESKFDEKQPVSGVKVVGTTKNLVFKGKSITTKDSGTLKQIVVPSGSSSESKALTLKYPKLEKRRPSVLPTSSAPKKPKFSDMTLKDFNIDDFDDIIELE